MIVQQMGYSELHCLGLSCQDEGILVHRLHLFEVPVRDFLGFLGLLPHLNEVECVAQFCCLEDLNQGLLSFSDAAFRERVPTSRLTCSVSLDEFQPVCVFDRFSAHDAHVHEITGHPKGTSSIVLLG
ncbi:MAG: hypothetical protein ACPHZ6_05880 [Poseidonia sp.]